MRNIKMDTYKDENKTIIGLKYTFLKWMIWLNHDENKTIIGLKFVCDVYVISVA